MAQRQARKGSGLLALAAVVFLALAVFFLLRGAQLGREYERLAAVTPAPSLAPPMLAYRELAPLYRYGSVGPEVIALQERLRDLGYYNAEIDGKYYDGTQAAVRTFQLQHGLDADGVAGEKTLEVLSSADAKRFQAPAATTAPPTAKPGTYSTPAP